MKLKMEKIAFATPSALPVTSSRIEYVRKSALSSPRCAAQPPKRIGAVAKDMQSALQSALRARLSRASLELPPGAKLGTEKRKEEGHVGGDRELCRIISSMFDGTGLKTHAIFSTPEYASAAKKMWGPLAECGVGSWDGGSRTNKSGFGKKTKTNTTTNIAKDIDVLLVVNPTLAQLSRVKTLSNQWGLDKLILLLNTSTKGGPLDIVRFIDDEFETVYCYKPNPHPNWAGGVLFRKFPDDWVLCRQQPPVGFLRQILSSTQRPTLDEIANALKKEGEKPSTSILNKLSSLMGNE